MLPSIFNTVASATFGDAYAMVWHSRVVLRKRDSTEHSALRASLSL